MIVDLNSDETLRKIYQEQLNSFNEKKLTYEKDFALIRQMYNEAFLDNVVLMGKMIEYVAFDHERAYKHWLQVMRNLMDMAVLAEKLPVFVRHVNHTPWDMVKPQDLFNERKIQIAHYLEGFLNAQVVRYQPIWWIEVGNEIGLTDIKMI
jgi:hypothetical protein